MARIDLSTLPAVKTAPPTTEPEPTPTPVPELEPVPSSTPVLNDFSALDILKGVKVKPSAEEVNELKNFAINKLMKDIPPEMKKMVVDQFIADMKKANRHLGDKQFMINAMHNVRDIALGVGEIIGESSKALYGAATGEASEKYAEEIQKKATDTKGIVEGYKKGDITITELKKRLATIGMLEPKFNERGDITGLVFIPQTTIEEKLKKSAQIMFAPHITAFKEISKGNLEKGTGILADHYYEHPVDFMIDASMVMSMAGSGIKGLGGVLKGAATSGSIMESSGKLAEMGEALIKAGDLIDPLQLSLRGTKIASKALLESNPWGKHLLSWMSSRKYMRLMFAESSKVLRERLIEDKGKIKEIFGPLSSGKTDINMEIAGFIPARDLELESFVANLEGLAQPIKPSETFTKSMELYKQWIEIEDKYLIGKKLLDSKRHREVIFQPMMAATGLSLNELEEFVRGTSGIIPDNAGIAEALGKAQKSDEIVSAEALIKAEEKSKGIPVDKEKLSSARGAISAKPVVPKDQLERAIAEVEGKPISEVADKITTAVVDDAEDTIRIATVNPWAAEKMQRLNAEIGRWDTYATRLRKKVPTAELPVAPRPALVEELKILKRDFDQLVDQAKGELHHEVKIELGPELTRAEKAERGAVHRVSRSSFIKSMRGLNAPDTVSKSLWEMATGGAPIEASGMETSISKAAEDIGKARYGGEWSGLDADQRMLARDSIVEEINELIKDVRAPIQRGEKLQMGVETKERLTDTITKIHKVSFELDRYAPSGAPKDVLKRAEQYTSDALNQPKLNPKFGELYEYKNKSGEVIRKYKQHPIWNKGHNKFQQYRRYVRRRNPVTMSKAEREANIQIAVTRINDLRLEKKKLMEFEESVAAAYDPMFHTPKIETDADAIIAHNLESAAADKININAWMQGTLESVGITFDTPLKMNIRYADAIEQSSHLVTEKRRALLAMYENDLDNIFYERNRLVKRSGGYQFPKGVKTSEGFIDNKKLKVVLSEMEQRASALRKAGKPGAGKIEAQAREYRLHRSEYNANQKEIDRLIKQEGRVRQRIGELNRGESPKLGELRQDPTRLDTAPPSNLGEKVDLGPVAGEKAAAATVTPPAKGTNLLVPKILGGDGKATKSAGAIIGDLSKMVRKDPDIMKALQRVREYQLARPGIMGSIGTGEKINVDQMLNLLRDTRAPKSTRITIRRILDAYNDARAAIPEAEGFTPFIVQQMFPKQTVTKADLLKGAFKSSLEAKLTEPVYYPHVFERQANVLDGRNADGKAIIAAAQEKMVDKADTNFLRRELGRQGYTGYVDETGKFHRITLGLGYRNHIRSVLGGKVQPAIRKPGFLKKRTGAWGYVTNDPASVLEQHRIEFRRFQRNVEIVDTLRKSPRVAVWDGNNENLLKKGDAGPDGKIVAEDYVPFSFEGTQNYFVQNVKFKQIYMGAIKDAGVVMDDALLQAVLQKMPGDLRVSGTAQKINLHQIPKSMNTALIDNLKLDMPPLLVRMFDQATDFWRGMTLAFSPRWYINNIIGNTILSSMAGVSPLSYLQSKMKMFDEIYPDELMTTGLVFSEATERSLRFSSARMFSRLYDVNANIENFYRRAAYYDRATKLARKELMGKTVFGFHNSNEMLEQLKAIKNDPALRNRVMDQVHEFLFDYSRMDPLERTWIRRIIPFWSWYKNIGKNFYLMPLRHPKKMFVLKTLAEIGHDAVEQTFNEMGTEWNDMPAFLQGRIVVPDAMTEYLGKTGNPDVGLISTRSFNPYADVFNLPANVMGPITGTYPGSEGRFPGVNPFLKVGLEQTVARGVNLGTGEKYTSPDQISTFGGGDVYIDPETGQSYRDTKIAPPLLEHILRQTPQWELIKDISYWIRFQKIGAQYGINDVINPNFLMDPKTGELKYPKSVVTSTLKLLGLNIAWIQNMADLQARVDQGQTQAFATKFNKLLVTDPKFSSYALEKVEDILNNKMTLEERTDLFRKLIRKKARANVEKLP